MLLLYNPVMPKEQLLLARLIGIAIAVVLAGLVIIGVAVSTSGILQPTVRTGRASVHMYRVLSGSMEPTVPIRATVAVSEGTPGTLAVGAIVMTHQPEALPGRECGPKPHMVKPGMAVCDASVPLKSKLDVVARIVAGPGDEIYVRDGRVHRKANGASSFAREHDAYIRACGSRPECNFPDPIMIPSGHWFLMGDNRGESNDSRFWGPVPTAWIVGTVTQIHKPGIRLSGSSLS
jgi:signal peptidase I